jgi:hypothetical protein
VSLFERKPGCRSDRSQDARVDGCQHCHPQISPPIPYERLLGESHCAFHSNMRNAPAAGRPVLVYSRPLDCTGGQIEERYSFLGYEVLDGETVGIFAENWGLVGLRVVFTRKQLEERLGNLRAFGHRRDLTVRVLAEWPEEEENWDWEWEEEEEEDWEWDFSP